MITLFLRCDPGVNSEVSDRVLPRNMLLFKGVECPPVCCMSTLPHSLHGMAKRDVVLGITRDAGLSSFLSHVQHLLFGVFFIYPFCITALAVQNLAWTFVGISASTQI